MIFSPIFLFLPLPYLQKFYLQQPQVFSSDRPYYVRVAKTLPTLGIAIEGGVNTQQPLPRIIAVQEEALADDSGLRVGQLIEAVDGIGLAGLSHSKAAKLIAERYAQRARPELVLLVRDQPAGKRGRWRE